MTLLLRAASILWWLAVGIWFAVIAAAGIAAAFVFGNLRETGLVLPDHAVSESLHWRYAAGRVMIDVFFTVDLGQAVAAILGVIALAVIAIAAPAVRRRWSFRVQAAAFLLAIASFGTYATTLAPEMNRTLRAQWAAAIDGDEAEAERLRASFDDGHQASNRLFRLTLAAVVVAGGAAAIGAAPRPGGEAGQHAIAAAGTRAGTGAGAGAGAGATASRLEEPRLRTAGR